MTTITFSPSFRGQMDSIREQDRAAREAWQSLRTIEQRLLDAVRSSEVPENTLLIALTLREKPAAKKCVQPKHRHEAKVEARRSKEKNRRHECRKGWKR